MEEVFNFGYLVEQCKKKQLPQRIKDRVNLILEELNKQKIDLNKLSKYCEIGIPEDIQGLRSLCWKLLLNYLPCDKNKWIQTTQNNKDTYHSFCNDFLKQKLTNEQIKILADPDSEEMLFKEEARLRAINKEEALKQKTKIDHPLSRNSKSQWSKFFEDQQLWDEIEKDTIRTRSELSFFVSPIQITNAYPVQFRTQIAKERRINNEIQHKHFDVLTRILFIYAKLNPCIRYVQGMNEILAPIYYTFYSDCNQQFLDSVESDAFFCFTRFMSDAKDSFMRQLDSSTDGIKGKIDQLNRLLKHTDGDLWLHFEKINLNPQFYSLRWIMLYLTQEFELFDVLRIWDSLLSKENRIQYMYCLCLGILRAIRPKLLTDDFTDVMEALQKLHDEDVFQILKAASEIFDQYFNNKN